MSKQYFRRCEVYDKGVVLPGLFHRWDKRPTLQHYYDENGMERTCMTQEIVGVVEMEDGSVFCALAGDVRFTDGLAEYVLNRNTEKMGANHDK